MDNTMINDDRKEKARRLVSQMTLEEKAGLCSGQDLWHLKSVQRLGLDTIMMTDGPHGLRKQEEGPKDNMDVGNSVPSVCFPTASALACSFDRELIYEIGEALGEECLQEKVFVLLGPGANQKRSPLCGRNFEYFSEDPVVSGEMAAALIQGVQSKGIGTSLKHFAVNNQEKRRMTINAVIDERTFRETYLKGFEIAVKKGKPWTVMCAYNRINGTYCSENEYLLTDILRKEWGFDGLVMSDWGAVHERIPGLMAGLDLEMPSSFGLNDAKIIAAVKKGELQESDLDIAACRITELVLKSMEAIQADYHYDAEAHHKLAIRAAQEAAVLLKNEDAVLPGSSEQQAAVIGALAKEPRYQGAGSSKINPIKVDNAWDALNSFGMNAIYSQGYTIKETGSIKSGNRLEEELIKEACEAAKDKDIVYIFAGLPEGYESEGFDRKDMSLPANQNHLIEAVVSVNPNVAVILSGGAPMELPWADKVKGILLMYLGGEGSGMAAANLILGEAVPSGKLAETWPDKLSDTPAYRYFPGGSAAVEYREGIYVGYRYYDKAGKHVRYPFGHGLSYASFLYSNLFIDKNWAEYRDEVTVSFDITNTSKVTAKETAMIWVSHKNDKVFLPVKELKEFVKIELQPGECKHVTTLLDTGSFGFYNTKISDWSCESGEYKILVGRSAHDICLQSFVYIHSPELSQPDYRESAPTYYHLPKEEFVVTDNEFKAIYGSELPPMNIMGRPYNASNTVMDVSHTLMGKLLLKIINDMVNKSTKGNPEMAAMMSAMLKEMPFHSMVASGGGALSENMLEAILHILNHHYLKGFYRLIRRK